MFLYRNGGVKNRFAYNRICNWACGFVTGPAGVVQNVPVVQEAVDRGSSGNTSGGGKGKPAEGGRQQVTSMQPKEQEKHMATTTSTSKVSGVLGFLEKLLTLAPELIEDVEAILA